MSGLLLLTTFLIIWSFIYKIGDPTQANIRNKDTVEMQSAYLITPVEAQIIDILSAKKEFIPAEIKNVPWSFQQQAYWLRIVINNSDDKQTNLVAHFDNPMLDQLSIFQVGASDEIIKQQKQGDKQLKSHFKQRIIPHFNFQVGPFERSTLYLRIATTGIANTPINIYQQSDFSILVQKKHMLWGAFIGILLVIGLYNLLLFFAIKDVVYLIYNGYIFAVLALMGAVFGYGFYLLPEPMQLIFNLQVVGLNCLVAIFVLLFLIYFLRFQIEKKWPYWSAIGTILILSLLFIISLWLPEYRSAPLFFILIPWVYVICLLLIFQRLRAGVMWGKLYIYSWLPLLVGAAIQPLVLTGAIEYSFLSHHAFMIAVLVEIVLMAMALADRMRFQEEQLIYHATHELNSGLPNITLLERFISKLLLTDEQFATCLLEIDNYQTLAPFIATKELQKLEKQVVNDILPLLNEHHRVASISRRAGKKSALAKVADGRLMFIFKTAERKQLSRFLKVLQSQIVSELQLDGLLIEVKTNIGICFRLNEKADFSANEFIQHSLAAIEQHNEKELGLHYYHDLQVINIKEHLTLACDLQKALRENQLQLYHQPQIELVSGSVFGSELLLRWNHPEHGFIPPQVFVAMAEDMGLINQLTRWVIKCALQQLLFLHAHQYLSHHVSINISAKDIVHPHFLTYVQEMMTEFNVPRDIIIFELTESVMVTDFALLESLIVSLNKLGIHVSIDDYGTGYSSLNYISQLQFDELKIDKAFVLDLHLSQRNLTIVKTTIDMAKNLNLKVVAEGVESKLIEQKLIESGCDIGQGYYYSQPLPLEKYLLWLDNYRGERS